MTTPRDPDALLVAYLADGMEVLPDRVVDAVLAEVHRTRQRVVFGPWRTRSMSRSAFGAAAVVAVLALGGTFLMIERGQPAVVGGPSPTPGASASPTEQASPSELAIPSPSARAASWTATGSMAGWGVPSTLLRDGRVLLIPGNGDGKRYPAELYDPTTGSWTATGSTFGVAWAVTLLDGRVLAASDLDPGSGLSHQYGTAYTELYDPGTGSWTTTGRMVAVQGGETVTLLLDGRVIASGGAGRLLGLTASAELYDPASGTWTATGSMLTPRETHTATLLPDGKVLVAGGYSERSDGSSRHELATAELYDPATGTWTATGAMSRPLPVATAALLRDGSVLVAEFRPAAPPCAAPCPLVFVAELYDPVTGTWAATESTPTPRGFGYTATLLPDGMLLVAGGSDSGSEGYGLLASAELYDPGTGSWTATATMPVARQGHSATLLRDGKVLVMGGEGGGRSVVLYDPGSP